MEECPSRLKERSWGGGRLRRLGRARHCDFPGCCGKRKVIRDFSQSYCSGVSVTEVQPIPGHKILSKRNLPLCHPDRSVAKWRDLLFPRRATDPKWKHHSPLCHPDRSGGICSAPLPRTQNLIEAQPSPLSSRAKPRDLQFTPPQPNVSRHRSLNLKMNCHPDRSVAKWRDLLFPRRATDRKWKRKPSPLSSRPKWGSPARERRYDLATRFARCLRAAGMPGGHLGLLEKGIDELVLAVFTAGLIAVAARRASKL